MKLFFAEQENFNFKGSITDLDTLSIKSGFHVQDW